MTEFLFRDDAYGAECRAVVIGGAGVGGIEFDRTIFYASSGGQPGDTGRMILADGREVAVTGAVHPEGDRSRVCIWWREARRCRRRARPCAWCSTGRAGIG